MAAGDVLVVLEAMKVSAAVCIAERIDRIYVRMGEAVQDFGAHWTCTCTSMSNAS